jgi:hypothetical protein
MAYLSLLAYLCQGKAKERCNILSRKEMFPESDSFIPERPTRLPFHGNIGKKGFPWGNENVQRLTACKSVVKVIGSTLTPLQVVVEGITAMHYCGVGTSARHPNQCSTSLIV